MGRGIWFDPGLGLNASRSIEPLIERTCTLEYRGISLADLARELVEIAASGLRRQGQLNERGDDERIYLDRLEELVRGGKSLARSFAEMWEGPWNREVGRLIDHTTYRFPG